MAVDFGDARTGVAVSDLTKTLVGDAWVIHSKNIKETSCKVAEEAKAREVSCIVVGLPKNMDGSRGFRAEKSEHFAQMLGNKLLDLKCGINVVFWDERLTTVSANRILTDAGKHGKKRKQTVDAVAASLILEDYLKSL